MYVSFLNFHSPNTIEKNDPCSLSLNLEVYSSILHVHTTCVPTKQRFYSVLFLNILLYCYLCYSCHLECLFLAIGNSVHPSRSFSNITFFTLPWSVEEGRASHGEIRWDVAANLSPVICALVLILEAETHTENCRMDISVKETVSP